MNSVRSIATAVIVLAAVTNALSQDIQPGLKLTFHNESDTASIVAPNVALHVADGMSPNPFLREGEFTAAWSGFISTDIRGIYSFQARLNGSLNVSINGKQVLNVNGTGGITDVGGRVRLLKGTNAIVAHYTSPDRGDASLRLYWIPRRSYSQPIPAKALSHIPDASLELSQELHRGRELTLEHRCLNCHQADGFDLPELKMDAPTFSGIGSRRKPGWMANWIANPKSMRSEARMPQILHGSSNQEDSEAIAAYLSTLVDNGSTPLPELVDQASAENGDPFTKFHCGACHLEPGSAEDAPGKIRLESIQEKFTTESLVNFLKQPDRHFEWIRMPDFGFNDAEAGALALFLLDQTSPEKEFAVDPTKIDRGKSLVQTTGCLNCHTGPAPNLFAAKPLSSLHNWDAGCLSNPIGPNTPDYQFGASARSAIRAFAATGFDSMTRHVDSEFALRQLNNHNCIGCHDHQIDNVPPLHLLGSKMKPEYSQTIIAGKADTKPRPWIEQRMPGFNSTVADGVAKGLASLNGFPPHTPEAEPRNEKLAATGRKLVSPDGGFSCVACHPVGDSGAGQLFESPGINFATTFDRLQHEYFRFWMLNPLRMDPTTKMPVYFDDEKRSPLFEIYDGDAEKQIDALWHYLSAGAFMRAPEGIRSPSTGTIESFE